MAIKTEQRLFILENRFFSYILYADKHDFLRHLYYGNPLNDFEIEDLTYVGQDWSSTYYNANEEKEHIYEDHYNSMASHVEVSSDGNNDKKGSTVTIHQKDGSFYTDFRYESYRVYEGTPVLKTLPSIHSKKCESLEITLKDILSGVRMVLTFTIDEDSPIITRSTKLINDTEEEVDITRMMSLTLDISQTEFDLFNFHGDWALERSVERTKVPHGTTVISSRYGRSSAVENPFCILAAPNADDNNGECYGFNILWGGNFRFEVTKERHQDIRVNYGIEDTNFLYCLKSEEEIELPQVVFSYTDSGLNRLSQSFHDFIRNHIVPERTIGKYREIIFNSWEGCLMDFTTDSIIEYMNCAKEIGAELFVLDDGWFGHRDDDTSSLGDWYVNTKKIDLKKVIDHCHEIGMKFGLWFEPEMINYDSNLYKKHPEYVLGHRMSEMCLGRHQFVLDTSNDNAVNEIISAVNKILDSYDIDYVKWDNNREVADNYSYYLNNTRQESVDYLMTLGVYKMYKGIVETHPQIFFEGCASGGGKFDLGVLSYFPQIWCSDETDPVQRLFIQYGTGYGYPLSAISSHVSKCPVTSYTAKSNIAMFGTYGYEFNPTKLTEKEKEELKDNENRYHRIHQSVILEGDLYRLSSPFDSNYFCELSVSKDKTKALLLFANLIKEGLYYRYVRVPGLDPNKKYRNSYDNKVRTGNYYANVGMNFYRWIDEFNTILVEFEEVK